MPVDDTIFQRLQLATDAELTEICEALQLPFTKNVAKISHVYRKVAGHFVMNTFREKHELPYKKILIGVAEKLKTWVGWSTGYSLNDKTSEIAIEEAILQFINERIDKELSKLPQEKRQDAAQQIEKKLKQLGYDSVLIKSVASAIISGTIGTMTATPVTLSLFYSGFLASIWATIFGTSTVLLIVSGTGVGLMVALPLLVGTLGSPAYRKTIPATIHMILIRKRCEAEKLLSINH